MPKKILIVLAVVAAIGGVVYFLKYSGGYKAPAVGVNNGALSVAAANFSFSPANLEIKQGETVTWTNQDSAPHQISGNGFKSDVLNKGQSFNFTFNTVGTYDYICSVHPYMKGKIIVR